jgi:hypothetical protein
MGYIWLGPIKLGSEEAKPGMRRQLRRRLAHRWQQLARSSKMRQGRARRELGREREEEKGALASSSAYARIRVATRRTCGW